MLRALAILVALVADASAGSVDWSQYIDKNPSAPMPVAKPAAQPAAQPAAKPAKAAKQKPAKVAKAKPAAKPAARKKKK